MSVRSASLRITDLPVRRLGPADLPACIALAADRGWPPEENKWRLMFAVSEAYGVDDPAGGLAGTVVLTRHGAGLAAVGMMMVASRHGRQGLGRRLMRYALGRVPGAVVFLTATAQGRPLYEQLGFRSLDTSTSYTGIFGAHETEGTATATWRSWKPRPRSSAQIRRFAPPALRPVVAADLDGLGALDLAVFGADRSPVLAELVTFADHFVECGEPVSGYAAAWRNGETRVIGPVIAADLAMATVLISSLAEGWSGRVRVDVAGRHADLARWAQARGLAAREQTTLMVHGGKLPGARARLFSPVSVAIG